MKIKYLLKNHQLSIFKNIHLKELIVKNLLIIPKTLTKKLRFHKEYNEPFKKVNYFHMQTIT